MTFHAWLSARVQVVVLAAELFWLAVFAYTTSDGARFFLVDDLLFVCGFVLVSAVWAIGILGHLIRRPGHRLRYILSLSWPAWWVREPYILAVALLLWFTPVGFATRLALSAPFVARTADAVLDGRTTPETLNGHLVGLFLVRNVDHVGEAVRFITGPCSLFDDCGFVYSPKGSPPVVGEDSYQHLWGPWWHWYRSF